MRIGYYYDLISPTMPGYAAYTAEGARKMDGLEARPSRGLAIFAIVALLGGAAAGFISTALSKDKKPEFLIEGLLPNSNTQLSGAVNLQCFENRGAAIVNATVRLVTDRLDDVTSPIGRVVKTQVRFSETSCNNALDQVRHSPQAVIDGVIASVEGVEPYSIGDNHFDAAERFSKIINDARQNNTLLFGINAQP